MDTSVIRCQKCNVVTDGQTCPCTSTSSAPTKVQITGAHSPLPWTVGEAEFPECTNGNTLGTYAIRDAEGDTVAFVCNENVAHAIVNATNRILDDSQDVT